MMRPMTCLSLLAALGAGLYLYQEKHTAQLLDRDINRTIKQAEQGRDRIGLMKAEWALLNEPERLQNLASQHLLTLQSLQPAQFARLEDLPSRLPAPSATPVNAPPMDDAPVASATPVAPIRSQGTVAMAQAASPVTAASPATPSPTVAAAHPAASPVQLAAAHPAPKPAAPRVLVAAKPKEPEPAAAPRPLYAPVMPAYAPTPVVIHAPTVQTASAVEQQPAPFVGSALGMARSLLAAPVPVASAATLGYANAR